MTNVNQYPRLHLLIISILFFIFGLAGIISGIIVENHGSWWYGLATMFLVIPSSFFSSIFLIIILAIFIELFTNYIKISKEVLTDKDNNSLKSRRRELLASSLIPLFLSLILSTSAVLLVYSANIGFQRNTSAVIGIFNDEDFVKYSFPGSGSISDPYLIENRIIIADSIGINIEDVTSSFHIRNCTIYACDCAIKIGYIWTQSTVTIENNTCIISPPEINNGIIDTCIYIGGSNDFIIQNNYCSCNVTGLEIVSSGILVDSYGSIIIQNNICTNSKYGIHIYSSRNMMVCNNTCNNNTNGINVYYGDGERYTFIIENNTCNYNSIGIEIFQGWNLTIKNNKCSFNANGMFLDCRLSLITRNKLTNNDMGISLYGVYKSIFTYNLLQNNRLYGIKVWYKSASENGIYYNNFINNSKLEYLTSQAFDESINYWYNITTEIGNYWSDLIWYQGCQYVIAGGNNTDIYPLQNPLDL